MRLADRVAQCRTPFTVENPHNGSLQYLNNAAAFSQCVQNCATRYLLSDELTALCTALAYSKGANTLACLDLLHIPAEHVWVEWAEAPRRNELARYGFKGLGGEVASGRRGAYIQSTTQGRRGLVRTFWAQGQAEADVLCSSMEAYFDFDTELGEAPEPLDRRDRPAICVSDASAAKAGILQRCFRFRYERSWQEYYDAAQLTAAQAAAVSRHALGTIAIDIPVMMAFMLLLVTRPGLPRRPLELERLNRSRLKSGKSRLLNQIEVLAPMLPDYQPTTGGMSNERRRASRLHHVRGHLVRRGGKIFWRVPHIRGSARSGVIRQRTVAWIIDAAEMKRHTQGT